MEGDIFIMLRDHTHYTAIWLKLHKFDNESTATTILISEYSKVLVSLTVDL